MSTCVANTCRSYFAKKLPGPNGVPFYSLWSAFPDLHAGGGQMDEPLDVPSFGSRAAQSVPKSFPGFVCFPVKAAVEKLQGVKPFRVRGEECGKGTAPGGWLGGEPGERFRRYGCWVCLAVKMAPGISHRMRMLVPRNVAVGRESTHAGNT